MESSCLAPGPSPDLFSAQIWVVQIVFGYEGQLFPECASAGVVILGNLQVGHPRGCGKPGNLSCGGFLGLGCTLKSELQTPRWARASWEWMVQVITGALSLSSFTTSVVSAGEVRSSDPFFLWSLGPSLTVPSPSSYRDGVRGSSCHPPSSSLSHAPLPHLLMCLLEPSYSWRRESRQVLEVQ